jgi:hypothetical protein
VLRPTTQRIDSVVLRWNLKIVYLEAPGDRAWWIWPTNRSNESIEFDAVVSTAA